MILYGEIKKSVYQAFESLDGWQPHGIGVLQKYVNEAKTTRVHVWHPSLQCIGMESGIHNHRYDFTSHVAYGSLVDEEYEAREHESGFWELWEHGNSDTGELVPTRLNDKYYRLSVRTKVVSAGSAYSCIYRPNLYHRTHVNELTITVVQRSVLRADKSVAVVMKNHIPVHGKMNVATAETINAVLAEAEQLLK